MNPDCGIPYLQLNQLARPFRRSFTCTFAIKNGKHQNIKIRVGHPRTGSQGLFEKEHNSLNAPKIQFYPTLFSH